MPVIRIFSHLHASVMQGRAGSKSWRTMIRSDLEFILEQILIAEQHAAGADLTTLVPNSFVPFGLRTVDGSFNNLFPGQEEFGAADQLFPRLMDPFFRDAAAGTYADTTGRHRDRLAAAHDLEPDRRPDHQQPGRCDGRGASVRTASGAPPTTLNDGVCIIERAVGGIWTSITRHRRRYRRILIRQHGAGRGPLRAVQPWFTFFGQFFDHGLDLVRRAAAAPSSFRCSRTIRSHVRRAAGDSRTSWC